MKRDRNLIAMHKIIPKEGNLVRVEVSERLLSPNLATRNVMSVKKALGAHGLDDKR
ncbi:MAG: hypothetical protein ABJB70_00685 [Candidatus Udaeobacter sp.]